MKFIFNARLAAHESGSKYYQVIRIQEEGSSRGIVITHWGKMHPGAPIEPRNHGQYKMEMCESSVVSTANSAIKNKKNRGYSVWVDRKDQSGLGDFEIMAIINSWLKPHDAELAISYLFKTKDDLDPFAEPEEEEYVKPVFAPAITESTKKEWGTW